MKKTASLLLGLVLLTGCARNYVITLNNGSQIATKGRPVQREGVYVYKDDQGRERSVFAGSVQEIAPASMVRSTTSTQFNPTPRR